MAVADFIHLRVHSAYSLSAGAIKLKDLPKLCKRHGMPAVAVTDAGNLFGALEFSLAAAAEGIQPIIGCELGLRVAGESGGLGRAGPPPAPEPVVLLCQNRTGYENLIRLVSRSYLETADGEPPQLALADLQGGTDGLLCLTGGPGGPVGRRLAEGDATAAARALTGLMALFPGRLYVELQRHGMPEEDRVEAASIDLAYRYDLPLVATNDVFFADPEFYAAHDVLRCIADGVTVDDETRRRLTPEHAFRSGAEMREAFADLPEACDNTVAIARRCAFYLRKVKPILPAFPTAPGRTEAEELHATAHDGLGQRLARQVLPRLASGADREAEIARYRGRLDYELAIIGKMGFAGYFLIVADFIGWAKRNGIPVGPGRGSGAGSVCAWALGITDLDPLPLNLLFERFLNPERVSMPDFDIDFCQDRRGEVLRYVQEKYGRDRVAQIITFGKLQARAVLRDVGRALALPLGQVDRIAKMVPNNPANPVTLQQAIDGDPQLKAARDGDENVARLIAIALKLEGLYRHASTHAAGVVIGDRPLDRLVPLYRDPRADMPATQFNMKYVEDAGLVKFDFLGLKTLTVIEEAVRLVNSQRAAGALPLDLLTIPLDDAKTYEMLSRGDTVGVFQLEGAGMRDMLRKLRPDRFEDIVATVALYRPGPMENIPHYIAVKHGQAAADYMHPSLEPVLRETYGIMIYQEQVMQIAQILAGYSLGTADLLRRAMGKKIKAEMDAQRQSFVEGAAARGIEAKLADFVFDRVAKFAGYGFNKSHAAAYALVAYQTAWLKANHPVEFLAASMSLDLDRTEKLDLFRQDLRRLGVALLPPDVNRSGVRFTVEATPEGPAVRYALAAVKGVGAAAMQALVAARAAGGPFRDLFDLAIRLDGRQFNKRQYEQLAKAGAFDCLEPNRALSFAAADRVLRHGAALAAEAASGQNLLFGAADSAAATLPPPELPKAAEWTPMERLNQEFEAIGFHLSAHPLDPYRTALARLGVISSAALSAQVARGTGLRGTGGRIRLAGIVTAQKERLSPRGNRYAFVTMSDMAGSFEVTVFSDLLAEKRALIQGGQPLLISVEARAENEEAMRLTAQSIEALDAVAAAAVEGLKIRVEHRDTIAGLSALLNAGGPASERGRGKLRLVIPMEDETVEVALPGQYRIAGALRAALQAVPGVVALSDY